MGWICAIVSLWSLIWIPLALGQRPAEGQGRHLLYLPIPSNVSKEEVLQAREPLKNRLHSLVKERLRLYKISPQEKPHVDFSVIFGDHDGLPILPNLAEAMSNASNLTTATTNDLTFTFNSPTYPWSTEELATLDTALGDLYPAVKNVYGNPAFNMTVNLRKDPTISFAGLYYPSLNEMVLKGSSVTDVICHEMIHAFRDDDIISLSSYEEGMTRAAEVEVHNRLANYTHWDEHHSYTYDVYYEGLNTQAIGAQNGNFFQGYVSALLRYQLSGYAWAKAFLENSNFFARFNKKLYAQMLSDPTTAGTESKLLSILTTVQPTVEGKSFLTWYGQQGVFNTNPPKGYFLYQRINQFTVDYFYRDYTGSETMQPNATIQWAVYDDKDNLLDSGSGVTSANGFISIEPIMPANYTGRIKVVTTTSSPTGTISNTKFRTARTSDSPGGTAGVFGTTPHSHSGTLTITPLNNSDPPVIVSVSKGAFYVPWFVAVEGRFRVDFTSADGLSFSRWFTKDASDYYLLIKK
jgi:hypothetical protein